MNIHRHKDAVEAKKHAADVLQDILAKKKDRPVLFLISGGSALELVETVDPSFLGEHDTIGVLDERYSKDETINNFLQLSKTTFWQHMLARGTSYIQTCVLGDESPENLARRFEGSLKDWRSRNPNGYIVATMGIGADGHTAGIMPFPKDQERFNELFEDKNTWVTAYDTGSKNRYPQRVTTTLSFLRQEVDAAVVYAAGEKKQDAFERVFANIGTCAETPARIVHEMRAVDLFYVSYS